MDIFYKYYTVYEIKEGKMILFQENNLYKNDYDYLGLMDLIAKCTFASFIIFDLNNYFILNGILNHGYNFDSTREAPPPKERVKKFFNSNDEKFNSEV